MLIIIALYILYLDSNHAVIRQARMSSIGGVVPVSMLITSTDNVTIPPANQLTTNPDLDVDWWSTEDHKGEKHGFNVSTLSTLSQQHR